MLKRRGAAEQGHYEEAERLLVELFNQCSEVFNSTERRQLMPSKNYGRRPIKSGVLVVGIDVASSLCSTVRRSDWVCSSFGSEANRVTLG